MSDCCLKRKRTNSDLFAKLTNKQCQNKCEQQQQQQQQHQEQKSHSNVHFFTLPKKNIILIAHNIIKYGNFFYLLFLLSFCGKLGTTNK